MRFNPFFYFHLSPITIAEQNHLGISAPHSRQQYMMVCDALHRLNTPLCSPRRSYT